MKILVTSDTHGLYDDISNYIIEHNDIDLLIHAGDYTEDAKYISYETGVRYVAVRGNNDYFDNISKNQEILDIKNNKILILHGHNDMVNYSYDKILVKAKKLDCNILIYGHTHMYVNESKDGILVLNPGSPRLARDGKPGFLVLEIKENIKVNRINI